MPKKTPQLSSLEIHLFGSFSVVADGLPVAADRWQRRKPQLLVKLLALQPHRQLHREQVMEFLWPEHEPESAANSLHKTIHAARRALEPRLASGAASSFILTGKQHVALSAPGRLWIDVDEFERLAAAALKSEDLGACEAALALYKGELLADDPYEDWALVRREQTRVLHRKVATKYAQACERAGRHRESIEQLKTLIASDPTDEYVHRQLMRLYALTGSKFQALEQFKQCRETLRREFDAEPEAATVEMGKLIIHGRIQPAPLSVEKNAPPVFHQLTFRRGTVRAARLSNDGKTIVYAAAWEGDPVEVFSMDSESRETHSLRFKGAAVLAVSTRNELALALNRRHLRGFINAGTLARAPLDREDAPREILRGVQWADWSPDGESLAVVRDAGGLNRLEFPIGTALFTTGGWISHPRVAPRGDCVSFLHHPVVGDDGGAVMLVDLKGEARMLSDGWLSAQGLAWSAGGDEVWFTATKAGSSRALHITTLAGEVRLASRVAGTLSLYDVSRDGRVLLSRDNTRLGIIALAPGAIHPRDLSWLDWSIARDISNDGRTILLTEAGEGAGPQYSVFLRRTDGSPAIRLGEGSALALSPDERWALASVRAPVPQLVLLPIRAGDKPRPLARAEINYQSWAGWFPDGERIYFVGNEPGHGSRLYVQSVSGGKPRTITPKEEGVALSSPHAVSPDGRMIAAINNQQGVCLYPIGGGEAVTVRGLEEGEVPIRWGCDGQSLYVFRRGELPAKVYRLDLTTGEKNFWQELMPPDPTGIHEILRILITPDLTAYAYTYTRDLSDLYMVSIQ